MTDTELQRRKAICEVAGIKDIGELSDGFHTFNSLYEQRMILFAALVKAYKGKAWKSLRHEDGELCFGGGWFIVGIDTPKGSYTYHYENKYFDTFDCEILDYGKHWDGHTEKDVTRLLSLPSVQPEILACGHGELAQDGLRLVQDTISRQAAIDALGEEPEVWSDNDEYAQGLNNQWHYDVNALKAVPSAQPEQRWIPCSERLPDECGEYLVQALGDCIFVDQWRTDQGGYWTAKTPIVAWMPLPEPWKEGEQE